MSGESVPTPPPVLWAQAKEIVYLTFSVECADPTIRFEKESVYFKGVNAQDKKTHELTIDLYGPIVPTECNILNKGRQIEVTLRKEKAGPFWPSLTKDKRKPHWLKVDFNRWKDEEDSGDEGGRGMNMDIEEMMRSMGGGGNFDGGDGKPSFDDVEPDSDDEDLPDLE